MRNASLLITFFWRDHVWNFSKRSIPVKHFFLDVIHRHAEGSHLPRGAVRRADPVHWLTAASERERRSFLCSLSSSDGERERPACSPSTTSRTADRRGAGSAMVNFRPSGFYHKRVNGPSKNLAIADNSEHHRIVYDAFNEFKEAKCMTRQLLVAA